MTKETTNLRRELQKIADRIKEYQNSHPIKTEEATKMALIVLFLRALGYEVTEPADIIPESAADIPVNKQEKVDYELRKDNDTVMIVECKSFLNQKFDSAKHWDQLYGYFHSMSKYNRFAILTNGIRYLFYSDLVERHRMDEYPFFEFDLLNESHFSDFFLEILNQFSQSNFNLKTNLETANELRTYSVMRVFVEELLNNPDTNKNKAFILYCLKETNLSDKWERQEKLFRQYSRMVKEVIDSCIHNREIDVTKLSSEEIEVKNILYAFIKKMLKNPQKGFVIFCWENSVLYKRSSRTDTVYTQFEPIIKRILKEYVIKQNATEQNIKV